MPAMFPCRGRTIERILRKAAARMIVEGRMTWKIDSPVERVLGALADYSIAGRYAYVFYYWLHNRKYYAVARDLRRQAIRKFAGLAGSAVPRRMEIDMMYSLHRHGASYDDYFVLRFPQLSAVGRSNFIASKMRFLYYFIVNEDRDDFAFLLDKYRTYSRWKEVFKRKVVLIDGPDSEEKFLEFATTHQQFIVKPLKDGEGRGVEKASLDRWESSKDAFAWLCERSPCVIEELLVNHEEIRRIAPNTLNTVRVVTCAGPNEITVFGAFIRFGRGDSPVDHLAWGGICAVIHAASGIIITPACDLHGRNFPTHPDTGERIVGVQLPEWQDALKLVRSTAADLPTSRCVGWDLAITPAGWVIIEANGRGDLRGLQLPNWNGKRQEFEALVFGRDESDGGSPPI